MNHERFDYDGFRAQICECGACGGNVHFDIWLDGPTKYKQFTAALPAIDELMKLAAIGKLDKYKAMIIGQRLLRRLPTTVDGQIPVTEAKRFALNHCPLTLRDIVEKIFCDTEVEEAELAEKVFTAFGISNDNGAEQLPRAANG
jgi:hypothetical protein